MEQRLEELQFVVSPSQKSTPRDGNCLPESLFDQAQYIPELASIVVDAYELRVLFGELCQRRIVGLARRR